MRAAAVVNKEKELKLSHTSTCTHTQDVQKLCDRLFKQVKAGILYARAERSEKLQFLVIFNSSRRLRWRSIPSEPLRIAMSPDIKHTIYIYIYKVATM